MFFVLCAGVAGRPTSIIVATIVVMAWRVAVHSIADPFIGLRFFRGLRRILGRAADGDVGTSQRHCSGCQDLPAHAPTGNGDVRTHEQTAYEDRSRQCRRLGDPPKHVGAARLPAGQDHLEVSACERTAAAAPDDENPGIGGGADERQRAARCRRGRFDTIDTRRKKLAREVATNYLLARQESERNVLEEEVGVSLLGRQVAHVDRPQVRARGLGNRAAQVDAHVTNDSGAS